MTTQISHDPMARLWASKAEFEKRREAASVKAAEEYARADKEAREAGRKWALEEASYEELRDLAGAGPSSRGSSWNVQRTDRSTYPEGEHGLREFQKGAKAVLDELNGKGESQ